MSVSKSRLTPVMRYGHLRTHNGNIVNQKGVPITLRGSSLFWSQWKPEFYNADVLEWLSIDWKIDVIRAAMAVDNGGYLENPIIEQKKIETVINAAIKLGIYVIIDWHTHEMYMEEAANFFVNMTKKFKGYPNIIFELWNEPRAEFRWERDIKPYHNFIIKKIRDIDPNVLIILGTENFSKRVDIALESKVDYKNIAYSFHFYAASHRNKLRTLIANTSKKNLPMIATEWGMCEANGDGKLSVSETRKWWKLLEENNIGYLNWAISDKSESASSLQFGANPRGNWSPSMLSKSGQIIRKNLRKYRIRECK